MNKLSLLILFFLGFQTLLAQTKSITDLRVALRTARSDTSRVQILYALSDAYNRQSKSDSSIFFANDGIKLGEKIRLYKQTGHIYRIKGVVLGRKGEYENALSAYQTALQMLEKNNDLPGVAQCYGNLCLLYKRLGDSKKSTEFTKKGIELGLKGLAISEAIQENSIINMISNNLGIAYRDLKDYVNARKYYLKAIASEKDSLKLGNPLSNLAQLYIDADKDYDKAIQIYKRAEKVNLANKNYPLLEHTYRNMGMAYSLKEDHEKAIAYGEKSVRLAETVKDPHRLFNAHGELYRSYRRKGDWENALKNVNRYRSIKDSLDEITKSREIVTLQADFEKQKAEAIATIEAEKQRRISEIQTEAEIEKSRQIKQIESNAALEKARLVTEINTRYETEKKEQKISELNLLNTAQNKQLQQLIIGIVLLVIFVGVLSWLYSIIRNRNRDLALKNEKINQQSRQLEVLMRELHHRVKNNLGIVSGLLFLQIKFLQDEKAIRAVKEGQQRIDAMGLIHQKLYQTENIEKVNIQEFVADLVDNLIRIYGFDKNSLALDFDIDDTDLNVDIAIPLGLIINELLTNSFKYAYLDVDSPELRVHLKTDKNIVLEVADNGKGLDINQWKEKKGSYGRQLINTLSNQIGADLTVENHHGTLFKLTILKENI